MKSFRSGQTQHSDDDAAEKVVRLFQSETAEIIEAPEPAGVRATVYVLGALLVSLMIVATVTRLDRVISSVSALVITTQPTVVLQALDPSIIKTIDVGEGQRVHAGEQLATLDPTFAAADVSALKMQLANLDAQIDRCEAELAGRPYDPPQSADPSVSGYTLLQKALYTQRKAQFDAQVHSYNEQIAQATASITKLQNNEARYTERARLAQEVEQMRATLAAAQVGSRLNLLSATDQKTEMLRTLESDHNTLIETRHQLEATVSTRNAFSQQWLAQTSQELVTARDKRDTALQSLEKASKRKDLVRLVASEDSVVLRMAKLSVGSVLKEGDPLLFLAPLRSPVEIEAHILSRDVGFIRVDDPVKVKLEAFNYVEHGFVEGKVRWISEGSFAPNEEGNNANPSSPEPYYKVRVALTNVDLRNVPDGFRLIPGMTASADIHIGTRSLLMYIVNGAIRGMNEAMREP